MVFGWVKSLFGGNDNSEDNPKPKVKTVREDAKDNLGSKDSKRAKVKTAEEALAKVPQPGTDRLQEIKRQFQELNLPQGIITGGVAVVPELTERGQTTSVSERGQRESFEKCDVLQSTLSAIVKSPVLDQGADISRSTGLRACLLARESEFKNKRCRTAYTTALSAIRQKKPSRIDELVKELGQTGECPQVLNILQGKGASRKPTLNLTRSGDFNAIPNLKNVLNDYINVQYHVNLTMIPEKEARRIQGGLGRAESRTENETLNELNQTVRQSGSVTLASTGEAARNLVSAVENEAEDLDGTAIERVDEAFIKSGVVTKIQSNLSRLAHIWNEAGSIRNILNTEEFKGLSEETVRLTLNARIERENQLTAVINELSKGDQLSEASRTSIDVSDRNYYNINSLKVENVHAPEYHDPFVSHLIAMQMSILEPHGLSFHEDLKNMALKLGYANLNPGRIVYKIDVWFSGYNPSTGDWVWNIPVNDRHASSKPVISYYVTITGMEANFTTTGTEYTVSFAPCGLSTVRPEEFSLEGTAISTGANPTFGTFLKNLSEAINKKRRDESKEGLGGTGYNKIYKFYAPDVLLEAPFYQGAFLQRNNLTSEDPKDGQFITIGKDIDVMTLLRSALTDLPEVQTGFLTDKKNNARFTTPVVHFTVRFNVRYLTKRPEIHDYDGIVYEYIIEPFLSFKKMGFDGATVQKYTDPSSQIARIRQMLRLGMIKRIYSYLNTSENTDVMNFDVKLNNFYYESLKRSFDPGARKGVNTATTPAQVEAASNQQALNRELEVNLKFNQDEQFAQRFQAVETSLLQKLFGEGLDDSAGTGGDQSGSPTSGFGTLGGGLGTTMDPDSYGSTTSDGNLSKTKDEYLQRFNDHFANDLLKLDSLEVRGDPTWLLSPYASSYDSTLISMEAKDVTDGNKIVRNILQPSGEKVIYLDINDVEQFDYMNPERPRKRKPTIMAGFYTVTRSESVFEGGKFIQKLQGYKMAHLNYAGQHMITQNFGKAASQASDAVPDDIHSSEWVTQVLDQGAKLPGYSELQSDIREFQRTAAREADETLN